MSIPLSIVRQAHKQIALTLISPLNECNINNYNIIILISIMYLIDCPMTKNIYIIIYYINN